MVKIKAPTLRPRIAVLGDRLPRHVPGSWRSGKNTTQRGYGYAWQKRREAQLSAHPLCCYCERNGIVTPASVADHITPHRGDAVLFQGPLQSLCASCHASLKQSEERSGRVRGCDERGLPLDPKHHWNASG